MTELTKFGTVVDSDVSRMIQLLIRLVRPQRILEIGTSIGYSTVSMAIVVKEYGGKITTIEYNEQSAKQAIKNFKHAGVAELIEVIIGDAKEIIPTLKESFDLIFQDVGDKTLYPVLLNNLVTLLKPGGVFLAEDYLLPARDMNLSKYEEFDQANCSLSIFKQYNTSYWRAIDYRHQIRLTISHPADISHERSFTPPS